MATGVMSHMSLGCFGGGDKGKAICIVEILESQFYSVFVPRVSKLLTAENLSQEESQEEDDVEVFSSPGQIVSRVPSSAYPKSLQSPKSPNPVKPTCDIAILPSAVSSYSNKIQFHIRLRSADAVVATTILRYYYASCNYEYCYATA